MPHITIFQRENTFRFYHKVPPANALFNTKWYEYNSFADYIKPFQTKVIYTHKCLFIDPVTIMVHTQVNTVAGSAPPLLYVLDHNKTIISTIDLTDTTYYKGIQALTNDTYTDPVTSEVTQMQCSLWRFTMGDLIDPISANTGIYYLQLNNYNLDGTIKSALSEPIMLYDSFPDTKLLQGYANYDKNGIINENWNDDVIPVFSQRVEADIRDADITTRLASFLDGSYLQTNQDSGSWYNYQFLLGSNGQGVPDHIFKGVEAMFNLDMVKLDGYWIISDDGQGNDGVEIKKRWSKKEDPVNPLIYATLPIKDKFAQQNALISPAGTTIDLLTIQISSGIPVFPFAVTQLAMRVLPSGPIITVPGFVCADLPALAAKMVDLNSTFVTANGLLGAYGYNSDGIITYSNDISENFTAVAAGSYAFYQKYTVTGTQSTFTGRTLNFSFDGVNTIGHKGRAVVDFGDSTVTTYVTNLAGNTANVSHAYTSGATFSVDVWHGGQDPNPDFTIIHFNFSYSSGGAKITAVAAGSHLPKMLQMLWFNGVDFSGVGFASDGLADCKDEIKSVSLNNTKATFMIENIFDVATFGSQLGTPVFTIGVDVSHNDLNSAALNGIVTSLYTHATLNAAFPGTLDLRSQTTGDIPTGAGVLTMLSDLVSIYGWTVRY